MEGKPSRLAQSASWYLQAVDAVPTDGWRKGTLCEAWTVSQVVAHVATGDQLFRARIFDAMGKDRAGQDLPVDMADRMRRFDEYATWEPAKIKATAQKESQLTVAAIAEALEQAPQTGESITLMTRLHQRSPRKGESANFHIHRTDGDGEWMLRAEGGQAVTETGHAKADVAMKGPAEGLYWVLMGRGKPEEHGVEVHGDPALAAAFKEWFPGP